MNTFTPDVKQNSACIHISDGYSSHMAINNKLLKETRIKMGLSQSDIGRRIGRDSSTINKMEDGQTKSLDAETLLKIANALRLNPFDIMSMRQAVHVNQDTPAQEAANIIDNLSPPSQQQAELFNAAAQVATIQQGAISSDSLKL